MDNLRNVFTVKIDQLAGEPSPAQSNQIADLLVQIAKEVREGNAYPGHTKNVTHKEATVGTYKLHIVPPYQKILILTSDL